MSPPVECLALLPARNLDRRSGPSADGLSRDLQRSHRAPCRPPTQGLPRSILCPRALCRDSPRLEKWRDRQTAAAGPRFPHRRDSHRTRHLQGQRAPHHQDPAQPPPGSNNIRSSNTPRSRPKTPTVSCAKSASNSTSVTTSCATPTFP